MTVSPRRTPVSASDWSPGEEWVAFRAGAVGRVTFGVVPVRVTRVKANSGCSTLRVGDAVTTVRKDER